MTKAVLLDLGNVIVGLDLDRAYRAAARHSPFTVAEIPSRIHSAELAEPYERGEMSNEEFHRRFCDALQICDLGFEEFSRLWGDMFLPKPLLAAELLQGLRARYRLVLVSNTNDLHFHWIQQRYPLLEHFHEYVLSYQVGSLKPAPEIYVEAIRRADCAAGECFFTDDNAANIDGALRVGLDAVLFSGEAQLRNELAQRGLRWDGPI